MKHKDRQTLLMCNDFISIFYIFFFTGMLMSSTIIIVPPPDYVTSGLFNFQFFLVDYIVNQLKTRITFTE